MQDLFHQLKVEQVWHGLLFPTIQVKELQDRYHQQTVEQDVESPAGQLPEAIVHVPRIIKRRRTHQHIDVLGEAPRLVMERLRQRVLIPGGAQHAQEFPTNHHQEIPAIPHT